MDVDRRSVTWDTAGNEDPQDYTFEVQRSESPEGPWDAISPTFSDHYIFVDQRIPSGDKYRQLWYRIHVVKKLDQSSMDSEPATVQADPDLVATYMRRHFMVLLTQFTGRSTWLFKIRTFGPRCRSCYDATLGQRVRESCLDCYDTGFLRGYHNPIEIWTQIDPVKKAQQNQREQTTQLSSTAARTAFYPNVVPGDVIVEAENKRWRVAAVSTTERLRAVVHQELDLVQIEETDIEYRLPVNLGVPLWQVQPSPIRCFENAADLNGAIEARTPDLFAAYSGRRTP